MKLKRQRNVKRKLDDKFLDWLVSMIQVDAKTGCWIWTGGKNGKAGYGMTWVNGKVWFVHRLIYSICVGKIKKGLELDHLCRTPACVNYMHLEPVTHKENLMRGKTQAALNSQKESCPQGHSYDATNTYIYKDKRYCRICVRQRSREWKERKRAIL